MNTVSAAPAERVASDSRAVTAAAGVAALTFTGDYLLWGAKPGLSLGLFALVLGGLLLANGVRTRRGWMVAGLLALSGAQFAEDVCLTGVVTALVLLVVLLGETAFPEMERGFERWLEAAWRVIESPGRWPGFGSALIEDRRVESGVEQLTPAQLGRFAQIVMPATALTLVFGLLLGFGNAIFGELAVRASGRMTTWLLDFDWSAARILLWLLLASLGIALVWHPSRPACERWWSRPIRRWARADLGVAFWQSALALTAVNALFFAVNTIDAIYLWAHGALPGGVNASAFVHEGVHSLIAAVALAALVLVAIFQQSASVAGSRWLRGLALVWVAQNLVLIASVCLRLKLYVDAYQLSELRVYVACFLALVTMGFFLLAQHVVRGMQIGALVRQNLAATFGLFFVLQFLDVGRVVADFNVRHWQESPGSSLDLAYLQRLGSSGWPALMTVARSGRLPEADQLVRDAAAFESARLREENWRATQWRQDRAARLLLSEVAFL